MTARKAPCAAVAVLCCDTIDITGGGTVKRKVICPHCGMSSEMKGDLELHCWACAKDFAVDGRDRQNVKFIQSNDGYHCWQAQPTAYHTIYACLNYPEECDGCIHEKSTFCMDGRIDFRMPVGAVIGDNGRL